MLYTCLEDAIAVPDDYVYAPDVPEIYRIMAPDYYYSHCINCDDDDDDVEEPEEAEIIDFMSFGMMPEDDEEEEEKPKKKKKKKDSKETKNDKKKKKKKDKSKKQKVREDVREEQVSNAERKAIKIDMIHLAAERERLQRKLHKVDPGKKKGARKIAEININIAEIDDEMQQLGDIIGEPEPKLDQGSKIGKFFGGIKRKISNGWKKVKKFCKRNQELILGVSMMVLPIAISMVAKMILKVS